MTGHTKRQSNESPGGTESSDWLLYLDRRYAALPWPWQHAWDELTAEEVAELPQANADFARYLPIDGNEAQVPTDLPRELPMCATRWAAYHDDTALYVVLQADRPTRPVPRLMAQKREDLSCAFAFNHAYAMYFGLNEAGESICRWQQFAKFVQTGRSVISGKHKADTPQSSIAEPRTDQYEARLIETPGGLTGIWRIARSVIEPLMECGRLGFTVARHCFLTDEMVAWGSGTVWQPRLRELGELRLVEEASPADWPTVQRVDMTYDHDAERGTFQVKWQDLPDAERLEYLEAHSPYARFLNQCTASLDAQDHVTQIAPVTEHAFALHEGTNTLELMHVFDAPTTIRLTKRSGHHIMTMHNHGEHAWPTIDELRDRFANWHETAEQKYHGDGCWGTANSKHGIHNISHSGAFYAERYARACLHLDDQNVYRERLRACCERALAIQKDEGWFPALAFDPEGTTAFTDGAFDTGSAGEMLVLGYRVLGEKRYLDAAWRIVDAYQLYLTENNTNYAAFVLWHLSELHEIAPANQLLELAEFYARHCVARGVDPGGAQEGHNYYSAYGGITLKGLGKFLNVLPEDHPYRPTLRHATIRMANNFLARQQVDGRFAERNRRYIGWHCSGPAAGLLAAAGTLDEANRHRLLSAVAATPEIPYLSGHLARLLATETSAAR